MFICTHITATNVECSSLDLCCVPLFQPELACTDILFMDVLAVLVLIGGSKCDRGDEINTKVRDDLYSFIKPSKIFPDQI